MPLCAVPVTVTAPERKTLRKRARGARTPHRGRQRALIVLAAAAGRSNARIAADLGISEDTVRKWRGRFAAGGLEGLRDLPRPGRPRVISAAVRAALVALACQLPAGSGVPLARWTGPELLAEFLKAGFLDQMPVSSVLRILAGHPVKPRQFQSRITPRDPRSEAKAQVILDLCQGFYGGEPLGPLDRILSFGARPSIQARERLSPVAAAAIGKMMRAEHEYKRHGALALLAGFDVHTGEVLASTPATTGIVPFMELAGQVMERPGYKNAPRVLIIVDNGSDHRGQASIDRMRAAHPNAILIRTPVHASWLNQVEIFFSIIQKKVISPDNFASLDQLSAALQAFIARYNTTARPFNWKFTAAGLADLMARITARQQEDLTQAA